MAVYSLVSVSPSPPSLREKLLVCEKSHSLLPKSDKNKNTVSPALDRPPSSESVAPAFDWNPTSQNHTPWCTVKGRYEGCIRQGAHGAEEHPCPGFRTNLQYRRNGARNTGSLRFVLLKMNIKLGNEPIAVPSSRRCGRLNREPVAANIHPETCPCSITHPQQRSAQVLSSS